jgi:NAD(P)-dependent dehydrogenase (short-subunit alcohol dehydrogenase family)
MWAAGYLLQFRVSLANHAGINAPEHCRERATGLMFGSYSSSKTAHNAITLAFASALESIAIKVNAACPGFTATNLNNFQGTRSVQQGRT